MGKQGSMDEGDALVTVQALLGANGLRPPDDEVERLARLYPGLRRTVDQFHEIDAGDEVMAAVFRAEEGMDR